MKPTSYSSPDPGSTLPPRPVTPVEGTETTGIFLVNTLVLDGDAATRDVLVEGPGTRGHQVTISSSFEEAARLLARSSFDCLIFKLRESWTAPLQQLLKYLPRSVDGGHLFVVAVVLDEPPTQPQEWLRLGVDDLVMGQNVRQLLDLRLAVAERHILNRRDRLRKASLSAGLARNFETVFRQAPEAVLVATARDGLVIEASDSAAVMLGLPVADLRSKFLSLVLPGLLGREELTAGWGSSDEPLRIKQVAHRRPDGTMRTLEVCLGRCFWSERAALWVRLEDVTEEQREIDLKLRAARLDATRSLAAGAAQALNDALTAVRGNVDLLGKQSAVRPETRDLLENALSACERAEQTGRTLSELARTGATPRRKSLDLRLFLSRSVGFAALRGRLAPEFSFDADLRLVEADEALLREAVQAVVENADQATPSGGVLQISGKNTHLKPGDSGFVCLEFRDGGEGITQSLLPKVFDPYFTTRQGRQGLGLSRALAILTAHGGSIEVESAPGHGTIVRLILPAAQIALSATGQPTEPLPQTRPLPETKGRVLCMDDDAGIRVIVEKMLVMHQYEVYCVRDGQEAIDAYRRAREMGSPFDVVLLDLDVRGGMGGRECIARLRGEFPGVKAVLTTGYLDDQLLENHREHGFSGVITKPFNVERLVTTVAKLVEI